MILHQLISYSRNASWPVKPRYITPSRHCWCARGQRTVLTNDYGMRYHDRPIPLPPPNASPVAPPRLLTACPMTASLSQMTSYTVSTPRPGARPPPPHRHPRPPQSHHGYHRKHWKLPNLRLPQQTRQRQSVPKCVPPATRAGPLSCKTSS